MAEGKMQNDWSHTSAVLAMMANVNRDPKKSRSFKPADFNPLENGSDKSQAIVIDESNIHLLKEAFTGRKGNFNGHK
ncbi:hypothetical protein STSP2_01102 [Anaerohalosphaera lusitana]|uniref:Uncharacterized protein n=1 Tax=Anaerohalosphaera lusitana TaxID=1936003 RepID=A0A1U9NK37_9BACT|nr:hypothetical protein [Anaerohalosphaera lusitana]AQT67950.1 hypothetical protein STSP2_01102 [Anaerohalosphaera lusitana]